jgi:CelD/BcsL family acetyltransferase involved in cellulose biosynthesis
VFDVATENSFDFLSAEYTALFTRSDATAFQHPLWLDRFYAKLVPHTGSLPLVIVVRSRADGALAMVLPMVRQRRSGMRIVEFADLQVSDYNSPVCDEFTFARIIRDDDVCRQIRQALVPYDILRIQKILDGGLSSGRLLGSKSFTPMKMSAHAVRLHAPYHQWRIDSMDRSYRKELDKKGRQLRRKGQVRFECSSDPEVIRTTFASMREYRRTRFQDEDLLQKPVHFDFYLELAIEGAEQGLARTYTLFMDDRPIAGVLGLVHRRL